MPTLARVRLAPHHRNGPAAPRLIPALVSRSASLYERRLWETVTPATYPSFMSGKLSRAVRERIQAIRRIYWRMSFKIMGGVYAVISLAALGISEFGTDSVQRELLFRVLIHRVPVWAWPAAALVIVAVAGVEGGVQDSRRLTSLHDSALAAQKALEDGQSAKALLEIEQERWYEEMRPNLEARIVKWHGRNFGRSHRLEIRIKSSRPLISIMASLPSDPRTGLMGHDLEAPRSGNAVFRPGEWVYVGDVGYAETPECEDDLIVRVRCRNEERIRWDDILVAVKLPKPVLSPFAFSSDS